MENLLKSLLTYKQINLH